MVQQVAEQRTWSQLVARAWCDQGFMERLRAEPRPVLAEHGLHVPEDTEVQVVEGSEAQVIETSTVRQYVMPALPAEELMDEELVGGGVAWWCAASGGCWRCGCRCVW